MAKKKAKKKAPSSRSGRATNSKKRVAGSSGKSPQARTSRKKSSTKKKPKATPRPGSRAGGKTDREKAAANAQRERSRNYQRRIAAAGREIGEIPPVFDPERKDACRHDLKLYLETYYAKAVRLGWSDDHLELIEALQKIILDGGQLAIGMPRGTGKTTIVIRAIAWALSYGHHRSAALVAATDPKARKALKGLKKEFQTKRELLEDFPEICFPIRCLQGINNRQGGQTCLGKPTLIRWSIDDVTFPSVEGSEAAGARIVVGGITGAVTRGEQETNDEGEVIRPSLILIDDFQTRESARSPDQTQLRLDIIEADIAGMAGPDETLSMMATVTVIYPDDGADQLLNPEVNPDWNGIRKKFLLSFPTDMELWEQYRDLRKQSLRLYRDIRLATAFYKKNRKKMDAGAEVSWKARFRRKLIYVDGKSIDVKEISAVQHAMEWFLVKPRAFASELQNEPESRESHGKNWLSAKSIEKKTHSLSRFVVPQTAIEAAKLISHLDVHDDLLYYAIGAVALNGSAGIIDYDTYPEQRSTYFAKSEARKTMQTVHRKLGVDGAVREALLITCKKLLDRTFVAQDGATEYFIDLLLIDCGHKWKIVNNVVLELNQDPKYRGRVVMARGFGIRASDTPFAERKNPKGSYVGNGCLMKPRESPNDAPRLDIDTNNWKTETHDRWATPLEVPGSLTLYRPPKKGRSDHQGFSEHQKAEFAVENAAKGRVVFEWSKLPQDNHWFDNVVGLLAGASYRGCDTPANAAPAAPRKKRRRRRRGAVL